MRRFGIYRLGSERPAPLYGRARPPAQPRRMKVLAAPDQREALTLFAKEEKLRSLQVDSWRFEWRGATGRRWRPDDGKVWAHGREWALVVTLRNGAHVHEARYVAWKQAA